MLETPVLSTRVFQSADQLSLVHAHLYRASFREVSCIYENHLILRPWPQKSVNGRGLTGAKLELMRNRYVPMWRMLLLLRDVSSIGRRR